MTLANSPSGEMNKDGSARAFMRGLFAFARSYKAFSFTTVMIVVSCFCGTLIPQLREHSYYAENFPQSHAIIFALSLNDIFHSKFFSFLLVCLGICTAACGTGRFASAVAGLRDPSVWLGQDQASCLRVVAADGFQAALDRALGELRALGYSCRSLEGEDGPAVIAERGKFRFLAEAAVHAGVIIVIAGVLAGNALAFKRQFQVYEGDMVTIPSGDFLRLQARMDEIGGLSAALKKDMSREAASVRIAQRAVPPRAFDLRIEGLRTETLPAEGTGEALVRNWHTTLTVMDGTQQVLTGTVSVNSPLYHGGFAIHQMTSGRGRGAYRDFKFIIHEGGERRELIVAKPGSSSIAADTKFGIRLAAFDPDMSVHSPSGPVFPMDRYPSDPGALIGVTRGGLRYEELCGWYRIGVTREAGGVRIEFADFSITEGSASGLQVSCDPGEPVVLAGALVMLAGFCALPFISRGRVVVRVLRSENALLIDASIPASGSGPSCEARRVGDLASRAK